MELKGDFHGTFLTHLYTCIPVYISHIYPVDPVYLSLYIFIHSYTQHHHPFIHTASSSIHTHSIHIHFGIFHCKMFYLIGRSVLAWWHTQSMPLLWTTRPGVWKSIPHLHTYTFAHMSTCKHVQHPHAMHHFITHQIRINLAQTNHTHTYIHPQHTTHNTHMLITHTHMLITHTHMLITHTHTC